MDTQLTGLAETSPPASLRTTTPEDLGETYKKYLQLLAPEHFSFFASVPLCIWPQAPPRGKHSYSVRSPCGIFLQVLLRNRSLFLEQRQDGSRLLPHGKWDVQSALLKLQAAYGGEAVYGPPSKA